MPSPKFAVGYGVVSAIHALGQPVTKDVQKYMPVVYRRSLGKKCLCQNPKGNSMCAVLKMPDMPLLMLGKDLGMTVTEVNTELNRIVKQPKIIKKDPNLSQLTVSTRKRPSDPVLFCW